jgi:apolipoprotein N-acyltransferase
VQRYDKRGLVPFAEYWPWPAIPPPAALRTQDVEAGATPGVFRAGSCRLGILICFEAERPALARELARSGADALLVLSNDANLPAAEIALEAAQARLRAAETGIPVVRVANAGSSFVAGGQATAVPAAAGRLRVEVPPPRIAAATTLGPFLLAACFALGAAGVAGGLRRLSASKRAGR